VAVAPQRGVCLLPVVGLQPLEEATLDDRAHLPGGELDVVDVEDTSMAPAGLLRERSARDRGDPATPS
jgi:hypothetical protein